MPVVQTIGNMNGVNFYSEQRKFHDKQDNEVLSATSLSA